jgi:transcriptional regulator with XRE-family HTH domain
LAIDRHRETKSEMEAQMKINGEAVRALRERKSWSQEHLANAFGLSLRTVQRLEADGMALLVFFVLVLNLLSGLQTPS